MSDNLTIARMSVRAVEAELNKRDAEIERLRSVIRAVAEHPATDYNIRRLAQEAIDHD